MDAGAGERGMVHEGGDGDFWCEAGGQRFLGCGQEEMTGAADVSAEDDDVGGKRSGVLIERQAQVPAEIGEGLAGCS